MPAKVVCRLRKFKDFAAIAAAQVHNHRERGYQHADPHGPPPLRLVGSGNIAEAVKSRIGTRKVRKNGVLAVELILSASPEYFRPGNPDAWGKYSQQQLERWLERKRRWLEKEFGVENIVDLTLHLDEATPHLHAFIVPITPQDTLSAAHWFDGPAKLRRLQDSVAAAVADLGIERGELFSAAEHQDQRRHYTAAAQPVAALPKVATKLPAPLPEATLTEQIPFTAAKSAREQQEAAHAAQTKQHWREVKTGLKTLVAHWPTLQAQANAARMHERAAKEATRKATHYRQQNAAMREELARFKEIPLPAILRTIYGAVEITDKHSAQADRQFTLDGRKQSIGVTDRLWIDNARGQGGCGGIDLVKYLSDTDFKGALNLLRDAFGPAAAAGTVRADALVAAEQQLAAVVETPPPVPKHETKQWPGVRSWLVEHHALPVRLVDWLFARGKLLANDLAAAIFPHERAGYSILGMWGSKFHRTVGRSEECGGYVVPGNGEVWLVESPLDAVSVKARHAEAQVLATLGKDGLSVEEIVAAIPAGRNVVIGLPAEVANQIGKVLTQAGVAWRREVPVQGKDFNADLRRGAKISDGWQEGPVAVQAPSASATPGGISAEYPR